MGLQCPFKNKSVKKYVTQNIIGEKKLKELMSLLSVTGGVVMGEDGFTNNLKEKFAKLQKGKYSKDMQPFIEEYKKYLSK